MTKEEPTKNIPERYKIVTIRIHSRKSCVYAIVDDKEDGNKRKGLFSGDAGKTYKLAWIKGVGMVDVD